MILADYLPVLLFIAVGIAVGGVPQVLGYVLGPNRPDKEKNSAYECGFEAFGDARMPFDVRYYLVAILFILFDLEIAFLFPVGRVSPRDWSHRFLGGNGLSGHTLGWFHIRMEKRRVELGVTHRSTFRKKHD